MYNKTGWYRVDDRMWAHMQGTCEHAERHQRESRMHSWIARPHRAEVAKFRTLRDAKAYVEANGHHQAAALS